MASVATVVVVGVKLPRRPRVKRGRRRWVGVIRRRILGQGRTILPGVILCLGVYDSTLKTQTTLAAAIKNVSAHGLVHRARTKIKVGSPLAKHVPVVLTALLVRQVVRILQLLVLLEPMPVEQQPFVIHVVLDNTTIKQVKLLVNVAMQENTKTKLEKHRARVVQQVLMPAVRRPFVIHVLLGNTTTKPVKRLNRLLVKVALLENTKTKREKHPATVIV